MSPFWRLFRAERVKLRKSWPMLTAVLAPLCQAAFLGVIFWFSGSRVQLFRPASRFWLELNYLAWNLLLMPIGAGLVCELSWEQEREARAWNLLLVQPVARRSHYLAKLLGHLSLLLLAQVLLVLMLLLVGFVLRLGPDLRMGPPALLILLRFAAFSALASVAVVAFQTWLSMRCPGLWAGLATALLGSWLTAHWVGASALVQFLPWGMAGQVILVFDRLHTLPWIQALGSLGTAVALAALGSADFVRHRETRA
jgi:hypothetical protein